MNLKDTQIERKHFFYAMVIPLTLAMLTLLIFLLQQEFAPITRALALFPRRPFGMVGIITSPLVHGSWEHMANNLVAFLFLAWLLFYIYRTIAWQIFLQIWIYIGILLWIIGRSSYHIGASGVIFGLAFFLMISGGIRKQPALLAVSFTVLFLYGSMFWYIFPWEATYDISWEAHLSGAIVGSIMALLYRKQGPQPPQQIEDDDIDDNNPYWLEKDQNSEEQKVENSVN